MLFILFFLPHQRLPTVYVKRTLDQAYYKPTKQYHFAGCAAEKKMQKLCYYGYELSKKNFLDRDHFRYN
jgi:hypothetical protein